MKNFLICLLTTLLLTGAFLSRPNEESYRAFVRGKLSQAGVAVSKEATAAMFNGAKFTDRWIYSTIEIDGKVTYAGVFGCWFSIPVSST